MQLRGGLTKQILERREAHPRGLCFAAGGFRIPGLPAFLSPDRTHGRQCRGVPERAGRP